jgi:hypothetical protein
MFSNEMAMLVAAVFFGVVAANLTSWILRAVFLFLLRAIGKLFSGVVGFMKVKVQEYRSDGR